MKQIYFFCLLNMFITNCGRTYKPIQDTGAYSVNEELLASGSISLSYDKSYRNRSGGLISDSEQSERCHYIAADYTKLAGMSLLSDSLKVGISGPGLHCLRRNFLNDCEQYEYIYTVTCRYRIGE